MCSTRTVFLSDLIDPWHSKRCPQNAGIVCNNIACVIRVCVTCRCVVGGPFTGKLARPQHNDVSVLFVSAQEAMARVQRPVELTVVEGVSEQANKLAMELLVCQQRAH